MGEEQIGAAEVTAPHRGADRRGDSVAEDDGEGLSRAAGDVGEGEGGGAEEAVHLEAHFAHDGSGQRLFGVDDDRQRALAALARRRVADCAVAV